MSDFEVLFFLSDRNFRNFFTRLTFLILVATFIGSFGPSITYIFEIFGPEHRSKVTTLITGAPTSIGYSLVALFAQLTRDWWWTMMCLIIITLLFPILLHFFVPESFLFLESKGRSYEAHPLVCICQ